MLVDILKKAEKKHKQEKSLAAKLITTPKFSVESLTKNYTEQIMDISSKKFSQVTLQQWLPSKEPKMASLIDQPDELIDLAFVTKAELKPKHSREYLNSFAFYANHFDQNAKSNNLKLLDGDEPSGGVILS